MSIQQLQGDLERREQEEAAALAKSLRIAAYCDYHVKRDMNRFNDPAQWPASYDMDGYCDRIGPQELQPIKEKK